MELYKEDDFKQNLMKSARIPFVIIGRVCRKSTENTKVAPPMIASEFLRFWSIRFCFNMNSMTINDMVRSSYMINDASFNSLSSGPFLRMKHIDCCSTDMVSSSLKEDCAVFLSYYRVAAIPEEETANTFFPDCLTFANTKFASNVFPVPPGASRKNILPLLFTTL